MPRVYYSTILSATVEEAWEVVRDFNGLPKWHPGITASELEDACSPDCEACIGSVRHFQLANGVRGHFRFMDYKKDAVFISINLAGGMLEEAGDTLGVSEAAGLAFSQPATSRLSSTEIQDRLTGQNIRVTGGAAGD